MRIFQEFGLVSLALAGCSPAQVPMSPQPVPAPTVDPMDRAVDDAMRQLGRPEGDLFVDKAHAEFNITLRRLHTFFPRQGKQVTLPQGAVARFSLHGPGRSLEETWLAAIPGHAIFENQGYEFETQQKANLVFQSGKLIGIDTQSYLSISGIPCLNPIVLDVKASSVGCDLAIPLTAKTAFRDQTFSFAPKEPILAIRGRVLAGTLADPATVLLEGGRLVLKEAHLLPFPEESVLVGLLAQDGTLPWLGRMIPLSEGSDVFLRNLGGRTTFAGLVAQPIKLGELDIEKGDVLAATDVSIDGKTVAIVIAQRKRTLAGRVFPEYSSFIIAASESGSFQIVQSLFHSASQRRKIGHPPADNRSLLEFLARLVDQADVCLERLPNGQFASCSNFSGPGSIMRR